MTQKMMDDNRSSIQKFADSAASTAEFYRGYAIRFEPGSQGYAGNMAEAAKYAEMAERYGALAKRLAE